MNKFLLSMAILLLFIGCNLKSRESFDLKYQDQNIMVTLANGPLKSIKTDGSFDSENHSVLDFDLEEMQVESYTVKKSEKQPDSVFYSIEIVKDISFEQGILRIYGTGPLDSKFMGVIAETNGEGAFLKFSIQDQEDNIIENVSKKENWEYVTNPIIFRINTLFPDQEIVSLSREEFFEVADYTYYKPKITTVGSKKTYQLEYATVKGAAESGKETITLVSTKLIPLFTEVYKIRKTGGESYLAIRFNPDPLSPKMKIGTGSSENDALKNAESLSYYNYQLRSTALRPNRVFKTIGKNIMVKLTKSPTDPPLSGLYYWEGTEELNLDPVKMTMSVISTYSTIPPYDPLGITNFSDYTLKVVDDKGDQEGIFSIKGRGPYNELFGGFKAKKETDGSVFLDFVTAKTEAEVETKLNLIATLQGEYQDKTTAIRPYRLIENMESIGREWVQLTNDGTDGMKFDPKNTEVYGFLSTTDRTLKYSNIKNGILEESFYKVVVVDDINNTNGVVKLVGYADDSFATLRPDAPMNDKYIAIDRGSELYKTQAKYAVGKSIEDARAQLSHVTLFNFHEKKSVPSNHRVITHMESYGTWVALLYTESKQPGDVPTTVTPGAKPTYSAADTHKWDFNTTLSLKLTLTVVTGGVPQSPGIYEITPIEDISDRYGIFKLARTGGNNKPDFNNKFIAIRTGDGTEGDRGYIGLGADPETAVADLDRIYKPEGDQFMNYHAESTAPVAPSVIKTIAEIPYIEYEKTSAGVPNGTLQPYDTSEYKFDINTLTMTIETYTPTSPDVQRSVYNINMRLDEGDYAGVFQALANGSPLHNKFFRIDVQQGANQKQKIRILQANSLADLDMTPIANPQAFTVAETTHADADKFTVADTVLQNLLKVGTKWVRVSEDDQMYDFKNTQMLTFDSAKKTITITDIEKGATKEDAVYTYRIMENDISFKSMVVRLLGSGSYRNKFLAFEPVKGKDKQQKFVIADTYQTVKTAITSAPVYVIPNYPWIDANVLDAYERLGAYNATTSPKGYGTPSFVWMKNGAYNNSDTETWTFNTPQTNVRVIHNATGDVAGVIATYSVHMISASTKTTSRGRVIRASTLFYLKSDNDSKDPYHNNYVHVETFTNVGVDAPGTESTFSMKISPDRATVESADTKKEYYRDLKSADVPARAINLAAAYTWVRVAPTSLSSYNIFQKKDDSWEEWAFDTTLGTLTVSRNDAAQEVYVYAPRTDESSHRGTFTLTATGSTPTSAGYHEATVAIGIGGEILASGDDPEYPVGTEFDRTAMRYGIATKGAVAGEAPTAAETRAKGNRRNNKDWNMRVKEQVNLSFAPLKKAADIDDLKRGWVRLKASGSDYIYDPKDTEKWTFKPDPRGWKIAADNPVYYVAIETASKKTVDYGMKLISTSPTGTEAQFQLFLGSAGATLPEVEQRTNTFVVLSLGTKLDEKKMRLGIGSTLQEAQEDYNANGFNWATLDRATAGWGGVEVASKQGDWMLTRIKDADDNAIGSSETTSGGGHIAVTPEGSGKPVFDPANHIKLAFDTANGILSVINIKGSKIQQYSYSMVKIDNGDNSRPTLETTFSLNGLGPYNNKFVYLEIAENVETGNENKGKRGRFSISDSLTSVKSKNTALKRANTWNFFQIEWTKVDSSVFTEAARRHTEGATGGKKLSYVDLDFDETDRQDVYDTRLTRTYTIIPTATTIDGIAYGDKSIIISNRSPLNTREDRYTYDMVESSKGTGQDSKAIALLQGTGPDGGKYIGIRIPEVGNSTLGAISLATTVATVKSELNWTTAVVPPPTTTARNIYRYRTELSVLSKSGILTSMQALGSDLVALDGDQVYMDRDTSQWTFSPDLLEATVVIRSSVSGGSIVNYSTVLVKTIGENATKGILYLKRAGAALDKHFVGVEIVGNKVRYYAFDTKGDPNARGKAEDVLYSTSADTTYPVNFVPKDLVYFPTTDEIFQALANIGSGSSKGGWSSLRSNFLQDTEANTVNVFFDFTKQEFKVVRSGTTYNMRYKPVLAENATPNTKAIFKVVPKKGETPDPVLNYKFIGVDLTVLEQPDSLRWVTTDGGSKPDDTPTNVAALQAQRDTTLRDPNYIPKFTFDIPRTTFVRFSTISTHCWQMVSEDGRLISSAVDSALDWNTMYEDPVTKDVAPWSFDPNSVGNNNYDMLIARTIKKDFILNTDIRYADRAKYFVRTMENSGSNDAVMRLYAANVTGSQKPIYDTMISNRFYALRVGEGTDYYKAKVGAGATIDEAKNNLANLTYFNLVAREKWSTDERGITNMNYNRTVFGVNNVGLKGPNWSKWGTNNLVGSTMAEYWMFDHSLTGVKSATYRQEVKATGGINSAHIYGLKFIVGPSAVPGGTNMSYSGTLGVYVLEGFGPHNNKFIAFIRSNSENRAAIYVPPTTEISVNNFTAVTNKLQEQWVSGGAYYNQRQYGYTNGI